MYSSCSEAEKKNSSIDPKISIHSIDSSAEVLLSPYKLVEINNRFIIKKHESIGNIYYIQLQIFYCYKYKFNKFK